MCMHGSAGRKPTHSKSLRSWRLCYHLRQYSHDILARVGIRADSDRSNLQYAYQRSLRSLAFDVASQSMLIDSKRNMLQFQIYEFLFAMSEEPTVAKACQKHE